MLMMKVRSSCGLRVCRAAAGHGQQRVRPGVPRHGQRTGRRYEPGRAARRHGQRAEPGNQRSGHRHDQQRRHLHHPVPAPGLLHRDRGDERVPEVHPHRHAARRSARPPTINVQLAGRRRHRERSTCRPRRRCSRPATPTAARSSTARASPSCRCSRAARWRSPCSSPASTTTRRRSTSVRSTTARSPPGR